MNRAKNRDRRRLRSLLTRPLVVAFASALVVAFASALVACGAAEKSGAPPAASPPASTTPAPEPTTVEEAQAELDRARADLDRSGATGHTATGTGADTIPSSPSSPANGGAASTTTPAQPRPPPPPPTDVSPQKGATPNYGGSGAPAPSPCEQACRALASIRHAKEAICRMAGASDARCAQAEKTLSDSEAKLTQCGCPK